MYSSKVVVAVYKRNGSNQHQSMDRVVDKVYVPTRTWPLLSVRRMLLPAEWNNFFCQRPATLFAFLLLLCFHDPVLGSITRTTRGLLFCTPNRVDCLPYPRLSTPLSVDALRISVRVLYSTRLRNTTYRCVLLCERALRLLYSQLRLSLSRGRCHIIR